MKRNCLTLYLQHESTNQNQVYSLTILLSVHPIQTLQYQFFIGNDEETTLVNIKLVRLVIDVC